MLRLNLSRDPTWIELLPGLSIEAAPVTTAVLSAARHTAFDGPDAPETPSARETAFIKTVARLVIRDWRGVGDTEGQPLAVSPATLDALMDLYPVATAFAERVVSPALSAEAFLDAEKNACTAARAGISAAARPIAGVAAMPTSPAAKAGPAPMGGSAQTLNTTPIASNPSNSGSSC